MPARSYPSCINRNIVECKENRPCVHHFSVIVLIETLWNVKISNYITVRIVILRINRNIVECKAIFGQENLSRSACINRNIVECKATLESAAALLSGISGDRRGAGPDRGAGWLQGWFCGDCV